MLPLMAPCGGWLPIGLAGWYRWQRALSLPAGGGQPVSQVFGWLVRLLAGGGWWWLFGNYSS